MAFEVEVEIEAGGWGRAGDPEALCRRAAAAVAAAGEAPEGSATVLLTDDATVRALNRDHRGQDRPTNVLSFPAPAVPGQPRVLGDVALAWETVAREAAEEGKALPDHLTHLVVHGLLHLLGHDHMDEAEADAMERLEAAILAGLGIPDPYREPAGT